MSPESAALIPILIVALLGLTVGGGYAYHGWNLLQVRRARIKTRKAHLALNDQEIAHGLLMQRMRQGYNSEHVRYLLRWREHEEPEFKGEDAGHLLAVQEATLRALNGYEN